MEGIFIPKEFYKDTELKGLERDVLALYKYYTENGTSKCCCLNSVQIAEYFNVSSRYIKSVRQHLKELGYIRTDGGIKVIYVGLKGEVQLPPKGATAPPKGNCSSPQKGSTAPPKGEPQLPPKGATAPPKGNCSSPQKGSTAPPKGEPQLPHKKEKKDKKEIKKEEKRDMTNFEMLIGRLPDYYLTEERMDYLKKNFMDKINDADMSCGMFDCWLINIKNELNRVFPMEYKVEKVEKKEEDNTIDLFW